MANPKNKMLTGITGNTPVPQNNKPCIVMDAEDNPILTTVLKPDLPAKPVNGNNLTGNKDVEERIRNSNERRRLIMNAALDAIICINTNGDITFWNPQAELIFGWTELEVMGKQLSGLIIPEQYRKRHNDGMAHYLKTGKGPALNKLMELSAINRRGEEFPIELTIMPIKQGGEEFFCAFVRDITERKKTDKALQAAYDEKNTILESIGDAFFAVDKNWTVTYWNKLAEKMLHTPKDEIVGQHLWEVFAGSIDSVSYRKYHQVIETNQALSFEDYYLALDKWFEISASPSDTGLSVYFKDITERKTSEIAIKKAYDEKNTVLERIDDGFFALDKDSIVTYWNKSAEILLDTKKEDLIGKNLHEVFVARGSRIFYDNYVKALREKITINFEGFSNLSKKWFAVSAYGSDNGLSVYFKDVTEHKKSEAALKKAFDEKNSVLESIDDGFFAVDKNSLVTYWNKRAEILLHAKREDVIGKNLHDMFANPDSMAFHDHYKKAIRENSTVHFEGFSKRSNKWFAVSAFASDNGLSVYFKDITEGKNAEEKIKESELRYRSLIEQATDTICIADTSLKFIEMNPSGCRMFGYSREEILQLSVSDVLFKEDMLINPIKIDELKAGKTTRNERRIKRKDGTAIEVELNGKMLEDGRIIIFGRDITERKQAELGLKESNERYNLISQATNDMVWDWDLVTGSVYRNKEGWKKIFGDGEIESEVGFIDDWDCRIHPDDAGKVKLVNEEIQQSVKDFFEVECRMLRYDGTYAYIHDRGNIIRNKLGKPVRLLGATQDITARKEAELQVAKSEVRFRSLVQNSSDLISIVNDKGYYMYCSPAIKRILGYDAEFIVGKHAFSFIHPDDIDTMKAHLAKQKAEKYLEIPTFRFRNAEGEWRWLESKISDMNENPEIQGCVFNSRDVTERKIAEEEIHKLSIIARETVNAVIITGAQGNILWVNEAFTLITEFEMDEVLGKKPGDFLQGEETNLATVRFMYNEIKSLKPFECDIINYSKSGRKYWIRIQSQPQFDEAGKLKYFFAIETDITKEKEAEEILKASEERYRYLFNHNPASIFIWDLTSFQVLEVNDTAIKTYGYYKEEFLTKTAKELSLPEEADKISRFASIAREKSDLRSEINCTHINKSGEEMHMSIGSHPILFKGRPAILAMAVNITEKVSLEKELDKERLEKHKEITNAVISAQEQERQELGGELHDNINQILAGSLLYLGLAKKELKTEHPYLTETETLISSAISEIRNLSHSLIPPSLNESELLGALNNIIEVTQQTSGLIIRLQAFGFDESIIPDKLKLSIYRIVQEQFNNILKHSLAKKAIVRLVQDNEKTMLSIKDDGIGFDTDKKGNGVGLMNIKTRASLFNGDVTITSAPGRGCELRVLFN